MAARNTTRYRVHHLLERCQGLTETAVINYREDTEPFFAELETHPSSVVIIQRLALSDADTAAFLDRLRETPVR
ncbi:MAG: hypothetical protein ACOCXA_09780, partial [Planctomycetota bacterium]